MLNIFKDIKKISVFGIAMVSSGLVSDIISHKKRKTPLMKMDIINMVMIKKGMIVKDMIQTDMI